MKEIDLKPQIRIAVCGLPDAGKSTFIQNIFKIYTGKEISPDTLMKEISYSPSKDIYGNADSRTMKCAKIMFSPKNSEIEFCMFDCPGHLEYREEIIQGLNAAHFIIFIHDCNRSEESKLYLQSHILPYCKDNINIVYSHSNLDKIYHYNFDSEEGEKRFQKLITVLLTNFRLSGKSTNIEAEALEIIKSCISPNEKNVLLFSGGKDSLVGLHLFEQLNLLENIQIYVPTSGLDFDEVFSIIAYYEKTFKKTFNNFRNTPYNVESLTINEILNYKAEANNKLVKDKKIDLLSIQYRASDEGVRSKYYHIVNRENHKRFSPVFYFSEANIWRYIIKHKLRVCSLYHKGFRSLGDKNMTEQCIPYCETNIDILNYIENHPETSERDGRTKQDKSEEFAMEHLRNKGFF